LYKIIRNPLVGTDRINAMIDLDDYPHTSDVGTVVYIAVDIHLIVDMKWSFDC